MNTVKKSILKHKSINSILYAKIHFWLRNCFGKANKCEDKNCKNISSVFEWALIKGMEYDYNRLNFIMLCKSCHKIYDTTDEIRKKISIANTGEKHNLSKLTDYKVIEMRKNNDNSAQYKKDMAKKHNVSISTIRRCLTKKTWKHI